MYRSTCSFKRGKVYLRLDFGDLDCEVDAGRGPGDGFPARGHAPSDLVAVLLGVLLVFLPQEVDAIQPAVLVFPRLHMSEWKTMRFKVSSSDPHTWHRMYGTCFFYGGGGHTCLACFA